jgi:hypothetical protein
MTWVAWRQHRMELSLATIIVAVVIAALLVTEPAISASFRQSALGACIAGSRDCPGLARDFLATFEGWRDGATATLLLPLFAGAFIGAPLIAGELEAGTYRLAWTQSVTRWRWLAVQLALVFGSVLAGFLVLTVLLAWWRAPFASVEGSLGEGFDQGPVLIAHAAFALSVGVALGALIGRSVPAIAGTVVFFVAARLGVAAIVRIQLLTPISYAWDPAGRDPRAFMGDLVLSTGYVDGRGQSLSLDQLTKACGSVLGKPSTAFTTCLHDHGILESAVVQPGDRYWLFQASEIIVFAALAAAFFGLAVWAIRRVS